MDITTERKKRFVVENSGILNRDAKLTILSLIMMEIGQSIIMETNKKEVNINLDLLEEKNIEVLNHIYNIVKKRLDTLSKPARHSLSI